MQLMDQFFYLINNPYIYIWPCSLDAYNYLQCHMRNLKGTKFIFGGYGEKDYFFWIQIQILDLLIVSIHYA